MPIQSLLKIAATVWSAAILIAVLVGLPTLMTVLGIEINLGLIVSALAALGSLTAASVALWVATSDRRLRQRERDAEDEAQARLVVVSAHIPDTTSPWPRQLQMSVTNWSPRAIVDVTFVQLLIDGHEHLNLRPTSQAILPVVAAGSDAAFTFDAVDGNVAFREALRGKWEDAPGGGANRVEQPSISHSTMMAASVRWTDASGKTWERRGSGPAQEKPIRVNA
ncbi:hypothetical protein [Mycobacterium marinum]|uniref:hypothetical protein n=1 Tax=Mycobacterium marinum TaxID=1781 RepID=UPI00056300ED|nr:hypothetical protein [Mycobacterium marinum]